MSRSVSRKPPASGLAIGAVARATGIPVETLRTWERRYGYTGAQRLPSGHRVYPLSSIGHLRRIAAALRQGHRPSEVVALGDRDLEDLLSTARTQIEIEQVTAPHTAPGTSGPRGVSKGARRDRAGDLRRLLRSVEALDAPSLRLSLEAASRRYPPIEFLERTIVPLMKAVGAAWSRGRLDVRREHLASACVADLLRGIRRGLERGEGGPHVALASLPGDRHELGPLLASVVFAEAGWGIVYLGADTPVPELVALAREIPLEAIAVGVSSTAPASTAAQLRSLARDLPSETALVVGGAGAPRSVRRAVRLTSLSAVSDWARRSMRTLPGA